MADSLSKTFAKVVQKFEITTANTNFLQKRNTRTMEALCPLENPHSQCALKNTMF